MAHYQALGNGIYCIETGLYRDGLAACYLITEGNAAAFIDTGTYYTIPYLLQVLEELGLTPDQVQYVIPTHVHLDHGGGAGELMAHCPNATLITHSKGIPHMIDPSKLQAGSSAVYGAEAFAKDYGKLVPIPAERTRAAVDGETISLNGRQLLLLDTPGHANHHICIFDTQTQMGFTGDTFGISYRAFDTAQGVWLFAPTTPVAFDPPAWQHSIDKLMALNPKAMHLTHYNRVTEVERLSHSLRQSIHDLSQIARNAYEIEPDSQQRQQLMQEQIRTLWLNQLREHGCTLSTETCLELLAVDLDLNVQGLEVWLQRLAKKAA
ncbi:MBL fold metallo-hydrolase [Thiofilum flexile]|uniref:MBL fold metallo-hydrolase n=1 Tax=Thiofilum flexile TaxID=125627 RepID=UPI0003684E18|nr:MBL fold metallo-hydrolase [Thiofilum flexile]